MPWPESERHAWPWVVPPIVLTLLVYFSITRNYFFTDDFLQMYFIADLRPLEYLVLQNAGHTWVVRNAVFLLSRLWFGTNPEYFFWTVLLTHLLNVGLLWCLVWRLTGSPRLACFGAALWGTSPLQEGALGWYAAYGHVMATTAMMIFLVHLATICPRGSKPGRFALTGWYVLALVGSLSFGDGIGIAMTFPLVIMLLLPSWRSYWRRPPLLSLWLVAPLLHFGLQWLNQRLFEPPLAGNPLQSMNALVVVQGMMRMMAFGVEYLLFGAMPVPAPTSMFPAYVMFAVFLALAIAVALRAPATISRQLAACALLALAAYGLIALGRGLLVALATPWHLMTMSRYQYAPLIPVTLALCVLLNQLATSWRLPAAFRSGALATWLTVTAAAALLSPLRIDHHDQSRLATERTLGNINAQINARRPGESVYFRAGSWEWQAFVTFFPANTVDGRRVYFVTPGGAPHLPFRGRRTATLFVSPDEVERDAGAEER